MKPTTILEMATFEHRFWLQILGDHSRFIYQALSSNETAYLKKSDDFIRRFDTLLERSRNQLTTQDLSSLNYDSYKAAMELREFKLLLLTKSITDKINISLPPTFFNHMVNELDDYLFILNSLIQNNIRETSDIQLHLLWLPDGAGHARAIASRLDDTEKELIIKSRSYEKDFIDLFLKSLEFNGYTRTGLQDFPALQKLNTKTYDKMTNFQEFLKEIEIGVTQKKILGVLSPLVPDHMYREECYYLSKLSMVTNLKKPECDPGKPRVIK